MLAAVIARQPSLRRLRKLACEASAIKLAQIA